jgi:hypothetical protein
MAYGSLIGGLCGMVAGLGVLAFVASQGEAASPPFTPEGIQDRRDRLRVNYTARALDRSVWVGIAAACIIASTPLDLGLASGTLGALQTVGLGSTLGTLAGLVYVGRYKGYMQKKNEQEGTGTSDAMIG